MLTIRTLSLLITSSFSFNHSTVLPFITLLLSSHFTRHCVYLVSGFSLETISFTGSNAEGF